MTLDSSSARSPESGLGIAGSWLLHKLRGEHLMVVLLPMVVLASCYVPNMTGDFDREHPFDAAVRFMEPNLPEAARARLQKKFPTSASDAEYLNLMSKLSNTCRTDGNEIVCHYARTFMTEDALFARIRVWKSGRETYMFETRVRRNDTKKATLQVCVRSLREKLTDAGTFVRDEDAADHTNCSAPTKPPRK